MKLSRSLVKEMIKYDYEDNDDGSPWDDVFCTSYDLDLLNLSIDGIYIVVEKAVFNYGKYSETTIFEHKLGDDAKEVLINSMHLIQVEQGIILQRVSFRLGELI